MRLVRGGTKPHKRFIRFGFLVANFAVLAGVGSFVAYNSASSNKNSLSAPGLFNAGSDEQSGPLDVLSSADIAVHVARVAGLDEAISVTNKADTAKADLSVSVTDDKLITKPLIISTSLKSKADIQTYKAVKGDTVGSIADKFGVSADTIRFSNNLSGDTVAVGKKLLISPVNGIVYIVRSGDTVDSIASKYRADKNQLIAFNDAELTKKFKKGEKIVIPDGLLPIAQASTPSSSGSSGYSYGISPVYRSNAYDYGWCTWHAANRRAETGNQIPSNLGNAISWLGLARQAGLSTGEKPRAGAVLYHANLGGLGHVAYVESVNKNGSFLVSDMNYPIWGQVTYRTVPKNETSNYRFIY